MKELVLILLAITALSPIAIAQTIEFKVSNAVLANPERGFWRASAENFIDVNLNDLLSIRNQGITLVYVVVRLDDYRDKSLSSELLAQLDQSFEIAKQSGVKIILRFAYNYPNSSSEYENAKDAPLEMVLQHIKQFGPMINKNKALVAVFQAGLIGAWGEQHTSSNHLDTPENKIIIRDALLEALDQNIAIQWRYPPDLISWMPNLTPAERRRTAFHNDCFLSSPTDVGTYAEDKAQRTSQRAAMMALTENTFHTVETCDAQKQKIRKTCKAILEEGAAFHVSTMNIDYYDGFHKAWKKQGCYAEIDNKMGYRFALKSANLHNDKLEISVQNNGWARLSKPRSLQVVAVTENTRTRLNALNSDLATISARQSNSFVYELPNLAASKFCISAPDPEPSLANNPAYAIRFANDLKYSQSYDEKTGEFCFGTNL